eukprot:3892329-Amphidinium_carterae.1
MVDCHATAGIWHSVGFENWQGKQRSVRVRTLRVLTFGNILLVAGKGLVDLCKHEHLKGGHEPEAVEVAGFYVGAMRSREAEEDENWPELANVYEI